MRLPSQAAGFQTGHPPQPAHVVLQGAVKKAPDAAQASETGGVCAVSHFTPIF